MAAGDPPQFPVVPLDITREKVLAKCEYYTKVNLWPPALGGVDPRGWLSNFVDDEERHAIYLLNAFLFFSTEVIDQVFVAACHSLSHRNIDSDDPAGGQVAGWNAFLDALSITAVRGERPAPTDSGALFTRRARHRAGFEKHQILEQAEAVAQVSQTNGDLLFVDDFAGTGNQFVETFRREFDVGGSMTSFASLHGKGGGRYFYCPVVATSRAILRIGKEFPGVVVAPGHELHERYSVLHDDSLIWPDDLKDSAREFVYTASMRAGIPDDPMSTSHWEGFARQALALAFEHGAPDATLPLIWWSKNEWKPLRGRG